MAASDQDLITALRANPEHGFRLLMHTYMQPVYWHIRRMVVAHDDAQDAAQETFVRVFRSFAQYDEQHSFKAWIFRIASNEALRLLDKQRTTATLSLDEATGDVLSLKADDYFDSGDELAARLQQAILQLPAKQQLTFNLRYYNEMTYEEIAETIGTTPASAKANYHVAKEKIIRFFQDHD